MGPTHVVLLPGAVTPADLAFGQLIAELDTDIVAVTKDLEVYDGPSPPENYGLDTEIAGTTRSAATLGWDRFHLVGFSAGGVIALAVAARFPERLLTLSLIEPAWAGRWDWSSAYGELQRRQQELEALPPREFMQEFVSLALAPGVASPSTPPGEQPAWMELRPNGIRAIMRAFNEADIDRDALRSFTKPVYFALGGRSNPDQYADIERRLQKVFSDYRLEVFEDRHHFEPPHRFEAARLARSLQRVWQSSFGAEDFS